MPPRLTLCIATLNRATYLAETLACIHAQGHPEVEVVVVDGASTDATAEVVAQFQRKLPLLKYERRDAPGGSDRDFDYAVEAASGEYCWLMSDDDLLEPAALRLVLERLSGSPLAALVVNAAIYDEDFSRVLRARALNVDGDRLYEPGDGEDFFVDTANYLSFIGALIVRREFWRSRARAPYFGSLFVHVGVLFQSALPLPAALLVEPLVRIRYGNAGWSARAFEIWMFKWPDLIWSFRFSDTSKAAVCARDPWRSARKLLLLRAKGSYSLREYRAWIRPRVARSPARWKAFLVGALPGTLCNLIAIVALRVISGSPGVALLDVQKSRFNVFRRLRARASTTARCLVALLA